MARAPEQVRRAVEDLDWTPFNDDMKAQIKARLIIADLLPDVGAVEARELDKWSCPVCGSSDGLQLYKRENRAFCYAGCGYKPVDAIDLARAALGLGFVEALEWCARRAGIDYDAERDAFLGRDPRASWAPRPALSLPVVPVRPALDVAALEELKAQGRRALAWIASHVDELGDAAARWLEQERGLEPEMCVHLGLRSTSGARWSELVSEAVELFGEEAVRLAGVLRADGAVYPRALPHFIPFIYHDAAGAPESMRIRRLTKPGDKPKCLALLNPPHLDDARGFWAPARPFLEATALEVAQRVGCPLYVCEGELDALAVWQAGRPALAVPGAGAWRAGWCASWASLARVIILAHQDGARATGEGLAYTIADRARGELGDEATRRILRGEIIPAGAGFKDANDLLRAGRLGRYLGACEDKP